jgi:predicted DNA-binding transcriptional regulator AlpA
VGTKSEVGSSSLERAAYSIPEFCFRNNISRPTYHRLRAEGRAPKEMRLGLNNIRITAAAERDWQQSMQEPRDTLRPKPPHAP